MSADDRIVAFIAGIILERYDLPVSDDEFDDCSDDEDSQSDNEPEVIGKTPFASHMCPKMNLAADVPEPDASETSKFPATAPEMCPNARRNSQQSCQDVLQSRRNWASLNMVRQKGKHNISLVDVMEDDGVAEFEVAGSTIWTNFRLGQAFVSGLWEPSVNVSARAKFVGWVTSNATNAVVLLGHVPAGKSTPHPGGKLPWGTASAEMSGA
ncbi:hypothetical protein B0H19DRAFT_1063455 [Mycena capillaripes]|nr:hypothetical protein B0H19DRAFT_1063455 [Mycena capillaripes]